MSVFLQAWRGLLAIIADTQAPVAMPALDGGDDFARLCAAVGFAWPSSVEAQQELCAGFAREHEGYCVEHGHGY